MVLICAQTFFLLLEKYTYASCSRSARNNVRIESVRLEKQDTGVKLGRS